MLNIDPNDWEKNLKLLEAGSIRSASYDPKSDKWTVNTSVKQTILTTFKNGKNVYHKDIYDYFIDKDNLPVRKFTLEEKIRFVPGGSSVRSGAYIAPGVIILPPSYINIGAYVDEGTMVDSHVLVGSCAQIGKRVHLSAGVQIGGVLEPIGMAPVIIEDDCFIGADAIIVEGILIKKRAVIAPGVILSKAVPVYDLVNEKILERGSSIPENAVVVPGSRAIKSKFAQDNGLSLNCAIIVKYRDDKSDLSLVLEESLRS
ncbi:MAG: 2,3,4,5-tetrahydropyridine-2,6-dicarboxylate N-succinyltransferase [Bacteriovoracaceae bacterium]